MYNKWYSNGGYGTVISPLLSNESCLQKFPWECTWYKNEPDYEYGGVINLDKDLQTDSTIGSTDIDVIIFDKLNNFAYSNVLSTEDIIVQGIVESSNWLDFTSANGVYYKEDPTKYKYFADGNEFTPESIWVHDSRQYCIVSKDNYIPYMVFDALNR